MAERIIGVMQTPDGYWKVEVVKAPGIPAWYRVWHAQTLVHDKAAIATVQRILGEAYATLVAADPEPAVDVKTRPAN